MILALVLTVYLPGVPVQLPPVAHGYAKLRGSCLTWKDISGRWGGGINVGTETGTGDGAGDFDSNNDNNDW